MTTYLDPAECARQFGQIDPCTLLLVAMLHDEVATLAHLHRAGAWKRDPLEIGQWLQTTDKRPDSEIVRIARREYQLQRTGCTRHLIEALASETDLRIDRERILTLAAAPDLDDTATAEDRRKARRRRAARRRYAAQSQAAA